MKRRTSILPLLVAMVAALALPIPVHADGGLVLPDPLLWAMIDEGQQIAVVHLQQDGAVAVDLFISMADRSGQSHQVTFFLPLGIQASDFGVVEETSLDFDEALTEQIEAQLKAELQRQASYKSGVRASLLLGAMATNGAWSWVIALPLWLSSCAAQAPAPIATFKTPSSQISIYEMNAETDLEALIETTGLDPKVKETLASLQGQQIAVVTLQTQPAGAEQEWTTPSERKGQPGIHLSWRSTLVSRSPEATYTYPLGTGKAWASPIELTRVYVVSPPELDFRVDYPRLGADLSGLAGTRYGGLAQRINWKIDNASSPAFAIDEAYGSFGHIWRGTYIKSNSAQDLVVTRLPQVSQEAQRAIRSARTQGAISRLTWLIGLLVGLAAWITAWRVVMPRRLGVPYRWRGGKLYGDALSWTVFYPIIGLAVLVAAGLAAIGLFFLLNFLSSLVSQSDLGFSEEALWLAAIVIGLPLMIVALGLANAFFYARAQAEKLQVTRGRAFGAYLLVVLMANAMYAAFAAAYAAIVRVI